MLLWERESERGGKMELKMYKQQTERVRAREREATSGKHKSREQQRSVKKQSAKFTLWLIDLHAALSILHSRLIWCLFALTDTGWSFWFCFAFSYFLLLCLNFSFSCLLRLLLVHFIFRLSSLWPLFYFSWGLFPDWQLVWLLLVLPNFFYF